MPVILKKIAISFFLFLLLSVNSVLLIAQGFDDLLSEKVHLFYYAWYGNPKTDGEFQHWNHSVIPHWRDTTWNNAPAYSGGNNIGANFYPALGCYSSNDPAVISKHFEWIKKSGAGVVAISWWGKNNSSEKSMKTYLDLAEKYGLKITFHIEPIYKSAAEFRKVLKYLEKNYLHHPAIFKYNGKPLFYLYDTGKVKYYEWHKLFGEDGELSVRNTPLDGVFIGHWERRRDGEFIVKSGFDGFYTYYASDGFMWGCSTENWPQMARFAQENKLLFIPCPGPGYIDTRIRPWNTRNTQKRKKGKYYETMFNKAVALNPDFIAITSFNEWHEGTQIEPAVQKTITGYTYEDYGNAADSLFYIEKTRELIERFEKQK